MDKYNQLARDAQLANDRVAMENFQQHAEHYLRLLSHAQREMDARREEQERQNRERQAERDRERADRQERDSTNAADPGSAQQPDVVDLSDKDESGLVETPENARPKAEAKPRKPRRPRKAPEADADTDAAPAENGDQPPAEAAE